MHNEHLKVESLDAFYGDFQALFDVSLSVDEGEVIAIIGANGAGKTTLMRSIAGLLENILCFPISRQLSASRSFYPHHWHR